MPFVLTTDAFTTEAEAVAHFEDLGCAVVAADVDANQRGLHWHDFDAVIAVVTGLLEVADADGTTVDCGPGTILEATDRVLHTERTEAGRFVFGFPGGMPDFSGPINLDPADHPSRA